jgi:general secretion pathway protein G
MKLTKIKNKKGLTLIELLVVLAILGILATILLANLSGSRGRARDVKRKGDLDQIRKALEMYKYDHPGYPEYTDDFVSMASDLEAGGYMTEVPNDPLGGSETYHYTCPRSGSDIHTLLLYACLENVSDPDADDADEGTDDLCSGTGRVSYSIFEP